MTPDDDGAFLATEPALDRPSAVDEGAVVRVATWNIHNQRGDAARRRWPQRCRALVEILRDLRADFVCLQEAERAAVVDIQRGLGGGYAWFGAGRHDGEARGEHAVILHRSDTTRLIDGHCFWLSDTPHRPGRGWDARHPRVVTHGRFGVPGLDQPLSLLCVHFDHRGRRARRNSARQLGAYLAGLAPRDHVVVAGDLNCTPTSVALRYLLGPQTCLVDSRAASVTPPQGPEGTWLGWGGLGLFGGRTDYVLVDQRLTVYEHRTVEPPRGRRPPSDHLAVSVALAASPLGPGG